MQSLSNGSTLQGGKYIIQRVLGQGGFGITYLATDSQTHKSIAIKEFFPKDYCKRDISTGYVTMLEKGIEKYKHKFISEANKIAQLNHKGIIKVTGVFEENGTAYYIMEYIAGQSLYEILKQRRFSLDEALDIIEKISKALAHIHSKRILHLDIKPMNIMIRNSDNEPIIIDFGISKTYDTQGNPNTTFLGAASPGYSPAEQFEGEINSFAPQLDIYALGATLYSIITGNTPPFPTLLTTQKLTFDAEVPSNVIDTIKKAMAYSQRDRFTTVKEFLTALKLSHVNSTTADSHSTNINKPIIKIFKLNKTAPYYVDDEIELSWLIHNCERVYLNGKLQSGLRKTKIIKYNSPGKKRLTLKAVNGDENVSQTLNFEVLSKPRVKTKDEATKIIVADIISNDAPFIKDLPQIKYFKTTKESNIQAGENIIILWDVENCYKVRLGRNEIVPAKGSKTVSFQYGGSYAYTLHATNEHGTETRTLKIIVNGDPHPNGYNKQNRYRKQNSEKNKTRYNNVTNEHASKGRTVNKAVNVEPHQNNYSKPNGNSGQSSVSMQTHNNKESNFGCVDIIVTIVGVIVLVLSLISLISKILSYF